MRLENKTQLFSQTLGILLLLSIFGEVSFYYFQYQNYKKEISSVTSESMEKFSELTHAEQRAVVADYSEEQKASTFRLLEMYEASKSFGNFISWKWEHRRDESSDEAGRQ